MQPYPKFQMQVNKFNTSRSAVDGRREKQTRKEPVEESVRSHGLAAAAGWILGRWPAGCWAAAAGEMLGGGGKGESQREHLLARPLGRLEETDGIRVSRGTGKTY